MHFSPQVALLEATLGGMLMIYFIFHAWCYDRWDCFRVWRMKVDTPRDPWKLKRVMTILYVIRLPAFVFKAIAVMRIKYQVGWLPINETGMPVPFTMWTPDQQKWINPLNAIDAFIWICDLCTHHEELCFWLFLIFSGPRAKAWFSSIFFKFFLGGCVVYAVMLSAVTAKYIGDPLKLEAVVFMCYSSSVMAQIFGFAYVLVAFPRIIRKLKKVGGSPDLIHRLLTFHSLNQVQITLRGMFGTALFIVSVDGLVGKHVINSTPWALDVLLFIAICGCQGGSFITLLVFMPRSVLEENGIQDRRLATAAGGPVLRPLHRRLKSGSSASSTAVSVIYDEKVGLERSQQKRISNVSSATGARGRTSPPRPPVPFYPIRTVPTSETGSFEEASSQDKSVQPPPNSLPQPYPTYIHGPNSNNRSGYLHGTPQGTPQASVNYGIATSTPDSETDHMPATIPVTRTNSGKASTVEITMDQSTPLPPNAAAIAGHGQRQNPNIEVISDRWGNQVVRELGEVDRRYSGGEDDAVLKMWEDQLSPASKTHVRERSEMTQVELDEEEEGSERAEMWWHH